ncbi:unnamed protein product [Mytilus edulis]|uniref:WSC domain-containing protein n=1 Tax=Mytilus edulis TaxID=6550 RepID=A0A8S3R0H6_MYTED|nr:unnamed protein product [Mytilus edulis]
MPDDIISLQAISSFKHHVKIFSDSLIAHSKKTTWLESFESCKDGFGGSAIFEHCQPSTCNASNGIGKIANISSNKDEYWINGFVQRSPVVVYDGCYYIQTATVSKIHRGQFSLSENSVFSCSHRCHSLTQGSFIFMNNVECLCVPKMKYTTINRNSRLSIKKCKNVCPGNKEDFCGGNRTSDFTLFSGYMIQAADSDQFKNDIGKTCGTTRNGKLIYDFCYKRNKAVCTDINTSNETVLESCTGSEYSWFDSQMACINQDRVLSSIIGTNPCTENSVWNGNHSAEVITWENYDILYGSIGGIVGFLAVLAIVVIVVILRHKSKISKTLQKRPGYYSEPTVPNFPKETHSLVNVTKEGVYNHLGDTHEKFTTKSSGPVYDVFGHVDVLYDVSITNNRNQENIGDLYDSSRAVEVYDTIHGREIKTRSESDTYNIVSTR